MSKSGSSHVMMLYKCLDNLLNFLESILDSDWDAEAASVPFFLFEPKQLCIIFIAAAALLFSTNSNSFRGQPNLPPLLGSLTKYSALSLLSNGTKCRMFAHWSCS